MSSIRNKYENSKAPSVTHIDVETQKSGENLIPMPAHVTEFVSDMMTEAESRITDSVTNFFPAGPYLFHESVTAAMPPPSMHFSIREEQRKLSFWNKFCC